MAFVVQANFYSSTPSLVFAAPGLRSRLAATASRQVFHVDTPSPMPSRTSVPDPQPLAESIDSFGLLHVLDGFN
jgi:hypothetical protein